MPRRRLESPLEAMLYQGLFPRIHDRKLDAADWYSSYFTTYVQRDVRDLGGVGDLDTGLLCNLLRIQDPEQAALHANSGAIFETFVVAEYISRHSPTGASARRCTSGATAPVTRSTW